MHLNLRLFLKDKGDPLCLSKFEQFFQQLWSPLSPLLHDVTQKSVKVTKRFLNAAQRPKDKASFISSLYLSLWLTHLLTSSTADRV